MALFPAEHNASLLWGTFRPGIYFGLRSQSYPTALAAGLMWVHGSAPTMDKLRHKCEQDEVDRYGFMAHDGRSFGAQPIVDSANGIALQTSFVRTDDGGWAVRIEGADSEEEVAATPRPKVGGRSRASPYPRGQPQSLFFYLSIDAEYDAVRQYNRETGRAEPAGGFERADPGGEATLARLTGHVRDLGEFEVLVSASSAASSSTASSSTSTASTTASMTAGPEVVVWGSANGKHSHLNVHELVSRELGRQRAAQEQRMRQDSQQQQQQQKRRTASAEPYAPLRLNGRFESGSRLVVVQVNAAPPFRVDVALVPGGCSTAGKDESGAGATASSAEEATTKTRSKACSDAIEAGAISDVIAAKHASFRDRLSRRLLRGGSLSLRGAPLSSWPAATDFGAHALSALLGSIGFFYGTSTVAPSAVTGAGAGRTAPAPLLATVPSRPFFPRGFLWDEGFHQLLVGAWDPALSDHITSNWLGLMHSDGWVPREQILGAEAEERVPAEFVAQHKEHANPPALLLRIQRLLDAIDRGDAEGRPVGAQGEQPPEDDGAEERSSAAAAAAAEASASLPVLRALWPSLVKWHRWFARTQSGEAEASFRWRGRDANDRRLNAMTLSSGLDDYPRATVPSAVERHVDLHCWMTFFARLLGRLARRLGKDEEAASFEAAFEARLAALTKLHWNERLGAFCDFGEHSNEGSFGKRYVVKCASRDGASQIEADVANPQRPDGCPSSHPRFLFPLGDGNGGLLTRESFSPRRRPSAQYVEHLGYVSLFPLMLKLLPPDSPHLLPIIELIRDPGRLWSEYGIRSLSASDPWYQRQNAPGDEPYWRGPIWVNLNYLVLGGLHHYATGHAGAAANPSVAARAAQVYTELRDNLVGNMIDVWTRTGYLWEQYDPVTGEGRRTHPFNGWSSLALLALAEMY